MVVHVGLPTRNVSKFNRNFDTFARRVEIIDTFKT
jgi:hypothetical protein